MKPIVLFISIILSFSIGIAAQTDNSNQNTLMEQAQKSFGDGKFIEARYLYKKAFEAAASRGNYQQAIECGLKANSLFVRENLYKEAFDLCRSMDALIGEGEEKQKTKFYDLRLLMAKERLQMYTKLKNPEKAKDQLSGLDEISNLANNDSISEEVLYTKANYYYTFGPAEQGVNCYKKLISKYQQQGDLQKATDCYKGMVAMAEKVNNAPLAVSTYKQYIAWADSVKSLTASNELAEVKQKYENSQKTLQEKDSELSSRQFKIIALCIFSAILIGALAFLAIMLMRFIWLTRKQKKAIQIANEHNQLKTQFIQNISAQMEPALNSLAQTAEDLSGKTEGKSEQLKLMRTQIEALRNFSCDIQDLSFLENSLETPYELKENYTNTFCEEIIKKVKPLVKLGVEAQVDAFKFQAKISPEPLEHVLIHLLKNAALYTETGKISLEFKKKGAHVHQFIVTDTGTGIPKELQENVFKPFTEIKDLTQGDGLGLPICYLMALKMNGNLSLDPSYTKGCRFVLELRT